MAPAVIQASLGAGIWAFWRLELGHYAQSYYSQMNTGRRRDRANVSSLYIRSPAPVQIAQILCVAGGPHSR